MTTRLPCSLRARLALGISISTMARARRSLSALSWPSVNGMAGAGRFGPAGSGGGAVSFVIVVLLGGLLVGLCEFAAPIMDPCRRSSDDEAAGPGRAARPLHFAAKEE